MPHCNGLRKGGSKKGRFERRGLAEAACSCDPLLMAKPTPAPDRPKIGDVDPFFHLEPGGDFNACVGRQGSEENYIDGYMEAAQELAAAVVDQRQFGKRDTLAMPILYNARHALELTLKFAGKHLHELDRLAQPLQTNHNIEAQWATLSSSVLGDQTVRQLVSRLEPFVASLAAIDEDGQELRYATNLNGKRSMETVSLIDLEFVQGSLDEMAKLLSDLKYRIEDLYEEKASGTWTDECSRSDLLSIAELLPSREQWDSEEFAEARRAAMERFELSSRRFSAALKKVEESRAAKLLIGLETPLAHITDEHLQLAVELWGERHPARHAHLGGAFSIHPRQRLREAMIESHKLARATVEKVVAELSPDEIADLETLFYVGRDRLLPEFYEACLERTKRKHALERDLRVEVNHIMEKLNFAEELNKAVNSLGRPSLGKKIEAWRSARDAAAFGP